jgi:hypothetical protein
MYVYIRSNEGMSIRSVSYHMMYGRRKDGKIRGMDLILMASDDPSTEDRDPHQTIFFSVGGERRDARRETLLPTL